jgi:hypothetical protein
LEEDAMNSSDLTTARRKATEIIINGTEIEVSERELSFERVVELADLNANGEVEYSVKYSRGHSSGTGILATVRS